MANPSRTSLSIVCFTPFKERRPVASDSSRAVGGTPSDAVRSKMARAKVTFTGVTSLRGADMSVHHLSRGHTASCAHPGQRLFARLAIVLASLGARLERPRV